MSSSTITYTSISSDLDLPPWGFHLMHPTKFEAPPSPNYMLGPEHPPSSDYVHSPEEPEQAPLSLDNVPEPEYPKYLAPSDIKAPIEDQPLPEDPVDGGDDNDDESSDDNDYDDDEEEEQEACEDDDEEEEHLALGDSSIVPVDDHVPLTEDTEAFETDKSAPTPIPSPPLPVPSPPLPLPLLPTHTSLTYVEAPLGYRAVGIRLRAASPPTHHPSEIPSPPMLLPFTTHIDDLYEEDMLLWKRAHFTAPTGRFKVGEGSSDTTARQAGQILSYRVDYGFMIIWMVETHELQMHYEDAQDDRVLLGAQRDVDILQRQRISDEDRLTAHIQHQHDRFRELIRTVKPGPQHGPADAEHKANQSKNGDDSYDSGSDRRRTVGHDVAYVITWKTLKKMITDKYYPRGEIKKLAIELWNLKVKCTDVESYNQHFQELALMCGRMFPEESDEVEKYVGGLLDMIQGTENKRKFEDTSRNNQNQQQPFKRHNVTWAYTAGPRENKISQPAATNNQRAQGETQRVITCIECRAQGHFKSNCLKLKNKNQENQVGNGNAMARAYDVGTAGTNPISNVVTGTFLLNNHYALILFDTGADRSFVSTAFTYLIDIIPATLDHGYDVELDDGKIIWVNTLIRGCTLNFMNHLFNIDLMPVEIGSFNIIIGMDWLSKYHAIIVCDEKIVCIPFRDEILIIRGDGSNNEHGSRLNIISCTKMQKYLLKGYYVFLAHVTTKKAKDKSKEKRLEDVPIVRDFPEVFPEDLSGIPLTRKVEF
ncbi:putative reverse transcriptase domain-containing protein [Tanacetum coccineum]